MTLKVLTVKKTRKKSLNEMFIGNGILVQELLKEKT